MDNAVALVQAYLHINGYFTVTEYPVVEAMRSGGYQVATDLDILAFRFPGAGRLVPGATRAPSSREERFESDPELGVSGEQADMLIGEVKEGRAELNRGARNPEVLRAVLARFGCCPVEHASHVVDGLLRKGHATTVTGHRVRLVAFGDVQGRASVAGDGKSGATAVTGGEAGQGYQVISLKHVVSFLQDYLRQHWDVLRHAQFKDPAFGFLMTLEKALGRNG